MFEAETEKVYRFQLESELDPNPTAKEVLDLLYGAYGDNYRTDYKVINLNVTVDNKWWHRLNMCWAWPLTIVSAPFQYVVKGYVGWSESTVVGKWILKVTGHID